MDKDNGKRIEWILELFCKIDVAPELKEVVQGMLTSKDNEQLKEETLRMIFWKTVKASRKPDQNTRKSLREIHQRLGFPQERRRPLFSRLRPLLSTAAVLALILTIGGVFWFSERQKEVNDPLVSQVSVIVPADSSRTINLPDGTEVQLFENAEFRYNEHFLDDRSVYLDGEACFKVAKLDGKRFTVNSSSITVTVLGTEFRMKAAEGHPFAEVLLAEGKVSVTAEGISETILEAGQYLRYDREYQHIELENATAEQLKVVNRALGRLPQASLDFDNSLDEIFQSLNLHYGKRIVLMDDLDLNRRIVAPFSGTETEEEVLSLLKMLTGNLFDYEITQDSIIIRKPI